MPMKLAALLLSVAACAGSFSSMRAGDWAAQGALLGESAIDAVQTQEIVRYGEEENPLVGSHGQILPFPIAGSIMFLAELGISWALPRTWRSAWEGLAVGAEGCNVYRNWAQGWGP
jgi:hypothetical protein